MNDTRIRSVATVRIEAQPNVCWVLVETEGGLVGLGETFFGAEAVEAYLHETAAPYLVGTDALTITAHWRALYRLWSRKGVGTEARGASAVDIALWDIFGQVTGLPLYQLLGGKVRDSLPVYNTCAGPGYQATRLAPGDSLFGIVTRVRPTRTCGPSSMQPEELVDSLLAEGIHAMKVFPFDATLAFDGGQLAGHEMIAAGIDIVDRLRRAGGSRMEIAVEMRSRWLLPAAKRIVSALEPFDPIWIEDPIRNDNLEALAELARGTAIPIAAGENIGSRMRQRELLASGAVGIALTDATWCGGVTEARRIGELAAVHSVPFGVHDCSGPVNLAVGVHVSLGMENAFMQEIVRAYCRGWYRDVADRPPADRGRAHHGDRDRWPRCPAGHGSPRSPNRARDARTGALDLRRRRPAATAMASQGAGHDLDGPPAACPAMSKAAFSGSDAPTPPSTQRVTPLTNEASSDATNATTPRARPAVRSGRAARPPPSHRAATPRLRASPVLAPT